MMDVNRKELFSLKGEGSTWEFLLERILKKVERADFSPGQVQSQFLSVDIDRLEHRLYGWPASIWVFDGPAAKRPIRHWTLQCPTEQGVITKFIEGANEWAICQRFGIAAHCQRS
jgi:hypothetical protein